MRMELQLLITVLICKFILFPQLNFEQINYHYNCYLDFFFTCSTLAGFLLFNKRGEVAAEDELDVPLEELVDDGLFKLAAKPARPIGLATVGAEVDDLLSDADRLKGDGEIGTSFRSVFIFSLTNRRADSFPMVMAFSNAEDAVVVTGLVDVVDDLDDFPAFFFMVLVHLEQYQIDLGSEISSFVAGGL